MQPKSRPRNLRCMGAYKIRKLQDWSEGWVRLPAAAPCRGYRLEKVWSCTQDQWSSIPPPR